MGVVNLRLTLQFLKNLTRGKKKILLFCIVVIVLLVSFIYCLNGKGHRMNELSTVKYTERLLRKDVVATLKPRLLKLQERFQDVLTMRSDVWETTADHQRINNDHQQVNIDHQRINNDHQQVNNDHQLVNSDHHQVNIDHQQVNSDHQQVNNDHQLVNSDHHQVNSDHHQVNSDHQQVNSDPNVSIKSTNRIEGRVLLLYDARAVYSAKALKVILDSLRVPVDAFRYRVNKTLQLVKMDGEVMVGMYSVMIFTDVFSYFGRWPANLRHHLANYSHKFNVTSIFFPQTLKDSAAHPNPFLLSYKGLIPLPLNKTLITQVDISATFDLYHAKNHISLPGSLILSSEHWYGFLPTMSPEVHRQLAMLYRQGNCTDSHAIDSTCQVMLEVVAKDNNAPGKFEEICLFRHENHTGEVPCIMIERGTGPPKIFVGSPVDFWLTKILLMDILRAFSPKQLLRFDRRRWVMIDIDDIFVAPEGLKMNKADVEALVEGQAALRALVPGLTFNLGFCGEYYDKGTSAEIEGSQELVRVADQFQWFGHVHTHAQPHLLTADTLHQEMALNREFASNHSILWLVNSSYAVSPHHSGVYPVYTPLYEAWGRVWNVTMTTTEEYPNLYPEYQRRGFIHRGIMVVPRQTCKLFTHTLSYDTLPGGRRALYDAAHGGAVFNTLLSNPISIFMTHVTNYASGRLALQLFPDLFKFTQAWTNLELMTDRPLNLGRRYFDIFPEDKVPIWGSPCNHKRHRDIYPPSWNCTRLPQLIILGPQKTGTTALYSFLKEHPLVESNQDTADHYEEVQFFSNQTLYSQGVEWYMDQFQYPQTNNQVLFEKSATYFTHPLAPKRVKALLPDVKLIVILSDPVKRAYSWYQHMRAHNDPTSLEFNFSQVIRYNETTNKRLWLLRQRCISPGEYHKHLQLWLEYFSPHQLLLIDGGLLVEKPAIVMETVQAFLRVTAVDYQEILKWNKRKGFYCSRNHCLGPSKGRHYPPIADIDVQYLRNHYKRLNYRLAQMCRRLGRAPPGWLY